MTMADMKCDVCGVEPAIGVAATSVPYSCAYCVKCCEQGADPELVFVLWANTIGPPIEHGYPDSVFTYRQGEGYLTYTQWYEKYGEEAIKSFQEMPTSSSLP